MGGCARPKWEGHLIGGRPKREAKVRGYVRGCRRWDAKVGGRGRRRWEAARVRAERPKWEAKDGGRGGRPWDGCQGNKLLLYTKYIN